MTQRIIAWLVNTFWGVIAASVIVAGLLLSLGRYYLPLIDNFRDGFEHQLSEMLSAQVSSEGLIGDWQGFNPIVGVGDLLVQSNASMGSSPVPLMTLNEAQLEIDMLRSLVALSPVYREALISGLQIHFYKNESGSWASPLFQGGGSLDISKLYGAAHDLRVINTQLIFHDEGLVNVVSLASFSLERGSNLTQSMLSVVDSVNATPMNIIVETTGSVGADNFNLNAYLNTNDVDLSPYRFLSSQLLHSDHASLSLWANWRTGNALTIHGDIEATNFSMGSLPEVSKAKAHVGMRYHGQQWSFFSKATQIQSGSHDLSLPDLRVDIDRNAQTSKISLAHLDLADSGRWQSLLPKNYALLSDALADLQPQGHLRNIAIQLHRSNDKWQVGFGADAIDLGVNTWHGAPAVSGLNGKIQHNGRSGWFVSEQGSMSLHAVGLYAEPFIFNQVVGRVGWTIGEYITIATQNLRVGSIYGDMDVQFTVDMNGLNTREKRVPTLAVQLEMANINASSVDELMPQLASTRHVRRWLAEGDLRGELGAGKLLINTSISKKEQWFPSVQLLAKADELSLLADNQWPRVQTRSLALLMSHRQLKAVSAHAKLLDVDLTPLNVNVVLQKVNTQVQLSANALGPMHSALQLFQQTPLAEAINNGADGWSGTGDFSALVNVAFELEDTSTISANVQASIVDANLRLEEVDLQFDHVQGDVSYDNGVLQSEQMSANVFGQPWSLKITTDAVSQDYVLAGAGEVVVGDITDWLEQPLLLFLQGRTDATAELRLSNTAVPALSIRTDLKGVTIDLPAPFSKPRTDTMTSNIHLELGDDLLLAMSTPFVQFDAVINDTPRGRVALANNKQLPAMPASGFIIAGNLHDFSTDDALDSLERYLDFTARYPSEELTLRIVLDDVVIDRLRLGDEYINNAVISAHNQADIWHVGISAEPIQAAFLWEEDKPLMVDISHVNYPFTLLPEEERTEQAELWHPSDLIALDISIAKLNYEGEDYGQWRFDVEPLNNAVKFNNITGVFKGMTIGLQNAVNPASLLWQESVLGQHSSTLQAGLSVSDVKQVFSAYALEPMLTSKMAQASIALSWPHEPFNVDHLQMNGVVDFQLKDGQFLRTEGAPTGFLKLLGVFNFDNLVRRMRLDFGDLVHEGLSYDGFSGELTLSPGAVSLSKPIFVDGPSSDFRMTGSLDLNAQTIDGELIAVVPVSRNLPWLAALAGGLPAAAGVYLASKVFSDEFDRLSSASYSIHGPWAEPEIKFERLFDDKNDVPIVQKEPDVGSVEQVEKQAE